MADGEQAYQATGDGKPVAKEQAHAPGVGSADGSQPPPAPAASPATEFRKCLFCAESIRTEALVCRFCHREVAAPARPGAAADNKPAGDTGRADKANAGLAGVVQGLLGLALLAGGAYYFFGQGKLGQVMHVGRPVPQVQLGELEQGLATSIGLSFSGWEWDVTGIKGKISYQPQGDMARLSPTFSLRDSGAGGECYSADGTRLSDVVLLGPGVVRAGQAAEVTTTPIPEGTRKVVVRFARLRQ